MLCLLATFYINKKKKDVSHPLIRPWGVMTLDLLTGIISSLNNQPATLLGDSDDAFESNNFKMTISLIYLNK